VISYGENYSGTPIGEGLTAQEGMAQPQYYWDPVIAPGGMAFYNGDLIPDWQGDLLIASLTPGGIVRLEMDGDTVTGEERLLTDLGRVRDVEIAPDGSVLIVTDADDGALLRLAPEDSPG
jgi:glucose/arabinose dehydrogenase